MGPAWSCSLCCLPGASSISQGSHCCRLHRRMEKLAHLPRGWPLPAWGEMSQGYKVSSPGLPPTPSNTHGGWVAVPTQLRRVLGRQQVPAGLSWPGLGSREAGRGLKNGSVGTEWGHPMSPQPWTTRTFQRSQRPGWMGAGAPVLTTFMSQGWHWHQVLLLCLHKASPEVRWQ